MSEYLKNRVKEKIGIDIDASANLDTEITRTCEIHGDYVKTVLQLLHKNPNCPKCSRLATNKKLSEIGKTKVGELNSFYGRHHTKESREKMSKSQLEISTPERREKISKATKEAMQRPDVKENIRKSIPIRIENIKKSMIERYGVFPYTKSEEYKQTMSRIWKNRTDKEINDIVKKTKDTKFKRYGNENYNNFDKLKETTIKNHGAYGFASSELKEKAYKTMIEKYGEDPFKYICGISQSTRQQHIADFEKENDCTQKLKLIRKYGQGWLYLSKTFDELQYCGCKFIKNSDVEKLKEYCENVKSTSSIKEKEMLAFLKSIYTGKIITNLRRVINPLELDIYIPEKKLAIEFNGNFYHSINSGKSFDYHLNKTLLCQKKGIRLIHIFEYEWDHKKDICKAFLASLLGIYEHDINSNLCKIQDISISTANEFLKNNSILFDLKQFNYSCGLFYNDKLVHVWCFEKYQKNYNLIYLCSKLYTEVDNTISMISNYLDFETLTSFVDLSKFTIDEYIENGFTLLKNSEPVNVCYKNGEVQLKENIKDFDPTSWLQICNCGYSKVRRKVK